MRVFVQKRNFIDKSSQIRSGSKHFVNSMPGKLDILPPIRYSKEEAFGEAGLAHQKEPNILR